MTNQFYVPEISCQHCVNAVTKAVSTLSGVQQVDVELDTKIVTVEYHDTVQVETIIAAINEAGYDEVTQLGVA